MDTGKIVKWGLIILAAWFAWQWVSGFVNNLIAAQNAPQLGDATYYPGWPYAAPIVSRMGATWPDNGLNNWYRGSRFGSYYPTGYGGPTRGRGRGR
jgi:hypothetical protein